MSTRDVTMKERRQGLGLSQQKVAELAQCSLGMVRLIEGGYKTDSPITATVELVLRDAEQRVSR